MFALASQCTTVNSINCGKRIKNKLSKIYTKWSYPTQLQIHHQQISLSNPSRAAFTVGGPTPTKMITREHFTEQNNDIERCNNYDNLFANHTESL